MRLLKEPLFHFSLIGAAIFFWFHIVSTDSETVEDLETITISESDVALLASQFEAMRNISRGVCLVDTRYSALAVALPPFWLIHNRMWAPFGAIMATYGVSIAVHPLFFMLVYVLVSIYFQKAQLQMLRAYYLFTEHFFWMKFAATSDRHAQEQREKEAAEMETADEEEEKQPGVHILRPAGDSGSGPVATPLPAGSASPGSN